jgi:hypothetical protein
MKKVNSILAFLLFAVSAIAQAPQKMNYQAVIRDSANVLINSKSIGMKISVLQGSIVGSVVYSETHNANTNVNGLVTIEIGGGIPVISTFSSINWANGPYFIKTETDTKGGANYRITSTSQLMSVPYALYASSTVPSGFKHYIGEEFNGGVIFHLYKGSDGQEHGLIVSNTETSSVIYGTSGFVGANRSWDGAYNTNLMTNSSAALYVSNLGAGWYIPSVDELIKLYNNRFEVNKALFTNGKTLLSTSTYYWSSTEFDANTAFSLNFRTGATEVNGKTSGQGVEKFRAIRAF